MVSSSWFGTGDGTETGNARDQGGAGAGPLPRTGQDSGSVGEEAPDSAETGIAGRASIMQVLPATKGGLFIPSL